MKDNTEQAFSHYFLSTHAQNFSNMTVKDANIQQSRHYNNRVKTAQARWIKDLLYRHKENYFLRHYKGGKSCPLG